MKYSRILLKLSGEALLGNEKHGVDPVTVQEVCTQIRDVRALGVEIGIVIGGGNIFRGIRAKAQGIDRVTGDYVGMLGTIINALVIQDALEKLDVPARIQSALHVTAITEPFLQRKANKHLEKGRVVIFSAGTGNPYFTTDTAAALRALEINANALLKATKVGGIYDKDPALNEDAVFFPEISYDEALNRDLGFMDTTAITICQENNLPVIVFDMKGKDNIKRVVLGENIGTIMRRLPCQAQ